MLITIIKRDLKSVCRNPSAAVQPIGFFVIVTSLFPLAVTPGPELLRTMAPGIIWISALLATLLALDTLFKEDFTDGTMDQILITSESLYTVAVARILSHWLISGLPLIAISLIIAMMLHLPWHAADALIVSLFLGTPVLSMVGSIGAALTVGLRYSGVLLTLIIMPLYIPVLIFGSGCISADLAGLGWTAQAYLLGAMLILSITLAPLATAAALRIHLN
ncbi:MAG: heme exporter protein CcmB [Gammaproteobacteria bacterium]|nr:heme exporter protein CcmB [Gammaproteobacteria bacterium]MYD76186.1 heme exporter protein CcmB [Gammaproteobacteria bacterium]MYJ52829.1 heme exporter protein CcmB [Gammaproteobacteria bacterium]